jgi:hypothetical protein
MPAGKQILALISKKSDEGLHGVLMIYQYLTKLLRSENINIAAPVFFFPASFDSLPLCIPSSRPGLQPSLLGSLSLLLL